MSKHALANDIPYHCTKSGKFSGTNSTYGDAPTTCVIGDSQSGWKTTLGNENGINKTFYSVFKVGNNQSAKFLEILDGTVTLDTDNLFAQQAIVLYLNAGAKSPYPLTEAEVVSMFKCAYGGAGSCPVDTQAFGITYWTADEIRSYFARLYRLV